MKLKNLSLLVIATCVSGSVLACDLTVSTSTTLQNLPSASGIVNHDNHILAVGDDSSQLFTLNDKFKVMSESQIAHYKTGKDGRIVKKVKPDFESMDVQHINGKPAYVILGSGSKKKVREKGFVIAQDKSFKIERDLAPLYEKLHQVGHFTQKQEINIEGLASSKDKVFIFNRGNSGPNMLFEVDRTAFENYMTGKQDNIDKIESYLVKLPAIDGIESGLSGATYDEATKTLYLTSSVEATGGAYQDGDILGSFVAELPLSQLANGKTIDLTKDAMPVEHDGKKVITKVESIAITSHEGNITKGVLASDNDNGTSQFFDFKIKES
ncbi:hypothetical protein C0W92_14535 [Photobacterium angustum]|uniref:Uncharacterized protein n=1 Tax=Photobacterium angustum TaxID=661 RepID=A0A2T3LUV3_PHOAN|nr:hypothetical protein [Photobacterium angustum]KJF80353.1 hypothetical protein UB36_17495 [Photobacterium damselae subsp. damselae]KJF93303.1 hypothetical protein UB39_16400 [Photobacterium angustum]KJG01477.1 hypothetical protein UB35_12840 [Photobacterium angustum]KJG05547.1 hypothetical protein UB33_13745 [Photobacterium angustum]KJG30056.1 hypothetical protein UA69_12125 [Photobacterium angustum]